MERYFGELYAVPFLWPFTAMIDGIDRLLDNIDSAIVAVLLIIGLGIPTTLISIVLALPLVPLTFVWWVYLAIKIDFADKS